MASSTPFEQPTLFGLAENVAQATGNSRHFALVVFDLPLRTPFTYVVPERYRAELMPGKRVLVPFGRGQRQVHGYCVGLTDTCSLPRLKPILEVLDAAPLLAPAMLELTRWLADRYYCSWGQVLEAVVPRGVKRGAGLRWVTRLCPAPVEHRPVIKLTPKQQQAFDILLQQPAPMELRELSTAADCSVATVKRLVQLGLAVEVRAQERRHIPQLGPITTEASRTLSSQQQQALNAILAAIAAGRAETFLLHGVTGSGKTEVYLQAIAAAVALGKEAIVLVPEISLTPQTIQRFQQRFPRIAILHSHLSDVDRNYYWQQIAAGEIQVVIGARSALFAPCPNLGMIVIDEEHETTFKQETTPRYHAREVAIRRAELEQIPLILGSATPCLESWQAAQEGRFTLLSMPHRVHQREMPRVQLIDLRHEFRATRKLRAISRTLAQAVEDTVYAGGQVILLLNRRGFSTAVICPMCGWVCNCLHCEVALTFHKYISKLVCHSCDTEYEVPLACGECGAAAIRYSGIGTERLEEEVRARFPNFNCARMDSDTMSSANHYEKVLTAFRDGTIHILLGTQMIAKGLDFPNVHLVGVVAADTARNLPDFRASERTFQLIAQVAGRTGRGDHPGRVFVQTFNPEDPAILAAARHDYFQFIEQELPLRREWGYPPFQRLVRLILRAKHEDLVKHAADLLAQRLRDRLGQHEAIRILGPAKAPIAKLRDYHRMHFQIHLDPSTRPHQILDYAFEEFDLPYEVEVAVDVDPIHLL